MGEHPPFQPLRPADSAAEAGALQTLRVNCGSQANALRLGLRWPSTAFQQGNMRTLLGLPPIRSTSGKFHGFLSADSKTPSKTLAISIYLHKVSDRFYIYAFN
jgi:hypothetical protein